MAVPYPPRPFPAFNTGRLAAGTTLVRFHASAFAGDAPNPCRGGPTRFAPIYDPAGGCVPSLYAAATLECAAFESVFHDVPHTDADKFVSLQKILSRAVSRLELQVDLTLANLFEPDLNRIMLTRADLIDTPASTYLRTARWAEAFHRAGAALAGLAWTSRRCDTGPAYLFFADRLPKGAFAILDRTEVGASADLLEEVRATGARAGITLSI